MNKKNILQTAKIVFLGLILSLGVSYAFAILQGSPPTDNVSGPINTGAMTQTKTGSLKVTPGGFSSTIGIFTDSLLIGGTGIVPLKKLQVVGSAVFTSTTSTPSSAPMIVGRNVYSNATIPDYTFYNDENTGVYHPTPGNTLGFSADGVERIKLDANGVTIKSLIPPTGVETQVCVNASGHLELCN
jgi:hypothetical protein